MTRICWTAEEELAVFVRANKLLESGQESGFGRALVNAQIAVLPYDRRRPEKSLLTGVTAIRPRYEQIVNEHKKNMAKTQIENTTLIEKLKATKQIENQIQQIDAELERKIETEALDRISIIDEALSAFSGSTTIPNHFLKNLIGRISSSFEDALVVELNAAAMRAHERVARTLEAQVQAFEELPKVKEARPKVLIVGFKSFFNAEFEKEFGSFLDLSFIDSHSSLKQVQRSAAMCDHVLLIKKFVSHSHTEVLKNHPGYKLIVGSVSVAKDYLTELSVKHDDANK